MLKRHVLVFPRGSAQEVVVHAAMKRSRGKQPSMQYKEVRDPRKALKMAKDDVLLELARETIPGLERYAGTPMLFQALGLGQEPFGPKLEMAIDVRFERDFQRWLAA